MEQPPSPAPAAADAEASAPAAEAEAAVERASDEQAHAVADEAALPAPSPRAAAECDADGGADCVHVPAAAAHADAEAAPEPAAAAEAGGAEAAHAPRPARGGLISSHFARQPLGQRATPLPLPPRPAAAPGAGAGRSGRPPRPSAPPLQPLPTALRERAGALASLGAAGAWRSAFEVPAKLRRSADLRSPTHSYCLPKKRNRARLPLRPNALLGAAARGRGRAAAGERGGAALTLRVRAIRLQPRQPASGSRRFGAPGAAVGRGARHVSSAPRRRACRHAVRRRRSRLPHAAGRRRSLRGLFDTGALAAPARRRSGHTCPSAAAER